MLACRNIRDRIWVDVIEMTVTISREPTLRSPGTEQVRVRPTAVGSMAVATIDAVGAGSAGFARGDRVAFPAGRAIREALAAGEKQPLVIGVESLIGVPKDISDDQAANLLVPGLVAREMLKRLRPVRQGDAIAVRFASGLLRDVLESWAVALGAEIAQDPADADVEYDETARRVALAVLNKRHGRLQQAAADVFLAIRAGHLDSSEAPLRSAA